MRLSLSIILVNLLIFNCFGQNKSHQNKHTQIVILHTNDLHSNLQGGSPEHAYSPLTLNDDTTSGGFSRIAGIIAEEKAKNELVLTLDGGDFLMGTLFQTMEKSSGFQLKLMKEMGYDAVCIGNHEFDFGIESLTTYITRAAEDSIPELLLANISRHQRSEENASFLQLYDEGLIKPYTILHKAGLKIGLLGLLGNEAYDVANASSLQLEKQIKTAKKTVKILREKEQVDLVIALSHSGLWFDSKDSLMMTEDAKLAQKVDGIDVIISGHTHTLLEQAKVINNTIIVQAGDRGKHVGKLSLDITDDGITNYHYALLPVNDAIPALPAIQAQIDEQQAKLEKEILGGLDLNYQEALFELPYDLNYSHQDLEQCNIGNFAADAINFYVNKHIDGHNDIALIGHGMIRAPLEAGLVHLPEVFNVASLGSGDDQIPGYPLARAYLSAKEIKRLMQLLIKGSEKSTNLYMFSSGLKIDYLSNQGHYKQIKDLYIADADGVYQKIDCSSKNKALYSIVADAYMLNFLGKIKKMSYGLINISPKDAEGNVIKNMEETIIDVEPLQEGIQEGKVWLALIDYAQSFEKGDKDLPLMPYLYKENKLRIAPIHSSSTAN